ncbi:zinc finger protein 652-like [Notolabrus celidotus]|uniref:zinc finger protein 652-like n=1 Tax=Notolabrus celidotus TaxID=1203425 RepID=UPI00148F7E44|nr:zinc finger protein 652-like [Notolabrus celidotus]
MTGCCVSGCSNQQSSNRAVKFYRISSGYSTCQANRRRLWLKAIQQVNGSSDGLRGSARVCGAHFISGEASMDPENPDFVPSIFKCTKQNQKRKVKRFMGRRKRRPLRAKAETGDTTTQPGAGSPADHQSTEVIEEAETPVSVPKEEETLTKEAETETKMTLPSCEAMTVVLVLDKKIPVLLLKRVFTPALGYRCQLCDQNFSTLSQLLKDEQLHQEGKEACNDESCEQLFTSQDDFDELPQVQEPSFPCNICDRTFTSTHHLKRHKLLHVKDGRKCNMCGVLFCQRHNHVLYLPQTEASIEIEEESPIVETENTLMESPESNQIPDPDKPSQSTVTVTPLSTTSPQILPSSPKPSRPFIKILKPLPHPSYTRVLTEIPLPVLPLLQKPVCESYQIPKNPSPSTEFKQTLPYRLRAVSQPSLLDDIELPPSLQMFSPKFLTSPFFEVTRNYGYILSKQRGVKKKMEEKCEEPPISLEKQRVEPDIEDINSFNLDVVF